VLLINLSLPFRSQALKVVHPAVVLAGFEQFDVRAKFDDLSFIQYRDKIGVSGGRQSMGDNDDFGAAAQTFDRPLDSAFGLAIQLVRRFVEDQNLFG
jgi:hypothetical protein